MSMTSASMYRLRLIGLLGAVTFITYGVLSQAWPIVATNIATLSLHVAYLRRFWALAPQGGDTGSTVVRWRSVTFEA